MHCCSRQDFNSPSRDGYRFPVNWKQGDDVIIVTSVTDDQAKERFPKGFRAVKPYLRLTPQP